MKKKPFWKSKTLWGVAIMLVAQFVEIPEDVRQVIPLVAPDAIEQIVTGVGALVALYGRIKAKDKVEVLPWRKGL